MEDFPTCYRLGAYDATALKIDPALKKNAYLRHKALICSASSLIDKQFHFKQVFKTARLSTRKQSNYI
jgi:hypothetical protein